MTRHLLLLAMLHTAFLASASAEFDRILIFPRKILGLSSGPVCHWSAVESKGEGADRLVQFEVATEGFEATKVRWRLPVYATQNGKSSTAVHRIGNAKLDPERRFRFHVSVADLGRAGDTDAFQLEVADERGHQSRCKLERQVIASLLDAAPTSDEARVAR